MDPARLPKSHKNLFLKGLALLVFTLFITFVSSFTTYYFVNKQLQTQLEFFKQLKQKDSIKITKNTEEFKYADISIPNDWKLYVNDQYGFSFRFSKNFKVFARQNSYEESEVRDMNPSFGVTISDQRGQNGYFINIYDKTLNDQISIAKRYLTEDNNSIKILSEQKIKKSSYNGIKLTYENGNARDTVYYKAARFFIEVKGKVYEFEDVDELDKMNPINETESKSIFNSLTLN